MTIVGLILLAAAAVSPPNACVLCHPDARVEFERSAHRSERVTCTDCHGGDRKATTVQAAHRGRFRGVPRRQEIPALCATCHSDIARMQPYNLPADQLALYQTSRHGIRLSQGDERVAVCTDCHGVHDIRHKNDPESSVFNLNIPATCGRCHGEHPPDGEDKLSDVYDQYAAGVHGQAFLQRHDTSAPHCASCHGAHGAAPPGVGDVDKVCGQCHATSRTYFLEGPHAAAQRSTGAPECASCHGNHDVRSADLSMLGDTCTECHEAGSPQALMASTMETLFATASEEIDGARHQVERAAAIPLYVEDYEARLEEARTALQESFPVMHALEIARVERLTTRARSIAHEVESEIEGKLQERRWQRVGLMFFWFYLIMTVAVLIRFRRRAVREASG